MRKYFFICVVDLLFGTQPILFSAAIEAAYANISNILLIAKDNKPFQMPKELAKYSSYIANHIEDYGPEEPILLPEIAETTLQILNNFLEFVSCCSETPEPLHLIRKHIMRELETAPIEQWTNILYAIQFLDIERLLEPFADSMACFIREKNTSYLDRLLRRDNRLVIESIIANLNLTDDLKGLLAKYWYLNYGTDRNFILTNLNYGFSVKELLSHGKLPSAREVACHIVLNLDHLRINDLAGVELVPGIESIAYLVIDGNRLASLPKGALDCMRRLRWLRLTDNNIANIEPEAFDNITGLLELDLRGNNLKTLPEGILAKFKWLNDLNLSRNKISALPPHIFHKQYYLHGLNLYNNRISELPSGLFDHLASICNIDLSDNYISTLPDGLLDNLIDFPLETVPRELEIETWAPGHINLKNNPLDPAAQEIARRHPHLIRY